MRVVFTIVGWRVHLALRLLSRNKKKDGGKGAWSAILLGDFPVRRTREVPWIHGHSLVKKTRLNGA